MPPARTDGDGLTGKLEIARRDLLDLGLRNTLLNYRPLRSKGIEVTDEKPAEIFRLLVAGEKSLTFLPGDGSEAKPGVEDLLAPPLLTQPEDEPGGAARHKDLRLQTTHAPAQLQSRLLATYHAARTSLEEQGVNTLYLALGMLSWREEDSSEKFCRAPLILIPVELGRSDARDRFHLKFTGEELGGNVSLAEKLKQSFGIRNFPTLPETDDLDIAAYFQSVAQAIAGQAGWSVDHDAIALGFFSFAKFLMYRDLDPATWPPAATILGHGILQSLLSDEGFRSSSSNYSDDKLLDDQTKNRELLNVVDSDSSQTIATLDSLDGHSMVIQGPPGTGKSQTIVNLIAGAVAQGKRVLFVSEKMAALDVVKRRLDKVRLGGACLELHSNRTNKKTIIEELRRTALGERPAMPQSRAELSLLADARDRLNAYCQAVNEPVGASGENPCSAYGRLLQAQTALGDVDLPELQLEGVEEWNAHEVARRTQLVAQLQERLRGAGVPCRHPFWGSQLMVLLPTDRDEIRKCISGAASACADYVKVARALAQFLPVALPETELQVETLQRTAQHLVGAPDLSGIAMDSAEWLSLEQSILQVLTAGRRHRDLHLQYGAALRPEAWDAQTSEIRRSISELGGRWWRYLSPRWHRARKALAAWCASTPPVEQGAQLALLDAIAEAGQCSIAVAGFAKPMSRLFPAPEDSATDWELRERQADWVIGAQQGIQKGQLAAWCLEPQRAGVDRQVLGAHLGNLDRVGEAYRAAMQRWKDRLQYDEFKGAGGSFAGQVFAVLDARWALQSTRLDELHALVAFNQIAAECAMEKLGNVPAIAAAWEPGSRLLAALYERARLSNLLARAFRERPALAAFDGIRHANTVEEFRRLDLLQLEHNRALLAAQHAQAVPTGGGAGEIGVLWHEFEKRARFLPIRSLMAKAGHAIQSIKPVFMMSPLSIANYLPPGAFTFDLIIFDEASQVRPVDALGAIARGQQVVVVGDSKQMPPTSFFDSLVGPDDSGTDEDASAATDIESVLGLFCSRGAHQRMLRWHYRSRHDSLIAISNHLFYDDRLVVFPSPDRSLSTLGLVYRRLENSPYERSRTRTSPVEAKTVAVAVMAHARSQLALPKEQRDTLGVAAFSMAQMDAVLNQLELLRRQDASCEEYFSYPPHEPFFVKNLENVQGDERDVIFISIGYGRTAEGYLTMSFGPLNRTGGERRLNVLISRARKRCEVFTSLCADDIDLTKTSSAGVSALKAFLRYAETGELDVPKQTGKLPDSEFEEQVLRELTGLGHTVHTQVGSAGFFLDLAVVDPQQPGRYVLGIECDGAAYHSARSARDRDRLRQAVLEGLGWRIHRIWSTDWFHNPDVELRKVVRAIEIATAGGAARPAPIVVSQTAPPVPAEVSVALPRATGAGVAAYECADVRVRLGELELHMVDRRRLADLLAQVVSVESPVHFMEASRRIVSGAGVQRLGTRIQRALEEAASVGVSLGLFARRGDFLWDAAMQVPPVRDRGNLPATSRKLEMVAREELRRAIVMVVQESYGIAPAELPNTVCRLLGFSRVSDEMSAGVDACRDELLRERRLAMQGDHLVVAVSPRNA